jgi:ArsR family transcriptional regulator
MSGTRASETRNRQIVLPCDEFVLLKAMNLIKIYECLCDQTRLRILHLLTKTPLCVCHFQDILGEPQVKISKHLGYLRTRGMVETNRERNWIIYSLPKRRTPALQKNLKCLQDCVRTDLSFKSDLQNLARFRQSCCEPTTLFGGNSKQKRKNAKTKRSIRLRSVR